jgi:hypothetical protein
LHHGGVRFALNVSLDRFAVHEAFRPDPTLFRHFTEHVRSLSGSLCGRRMYEVMRYWDEDHAEWGPNEWDFAEARRAQPKWVVSNSLTAAGPNATLLAGGDYETAVRALKGEHEAEIEVARPLLAQMLARNCQSFRDG